MRSSVPFRKKVSFFLHRLFSKVKFFFTFKIPHFFKYDLPYFLTFTLLENFPHVLAVASALVSIFAFSREITWLVIVGGIASFICRLLAIFTVLTEDDLQVNLNDHNLVLLLLIPVGFLLLRLFWKLGFATCFFLSVSLSVLFVYALNITVHYLWFKIYFFFKDTYNHIKYGLEERINKQAALEHVLKKAGLTEKQVTNITVDLEKHEGQWCYVVTYIYNGKEYKSGVIIHSD